MTKLLTEFGSNPPQRKCISELKSFTIDASSVAAINVSKNYRDIRREFLIHESIINSQLNTGITNAKRVYVREEMRKIDYLLWPILDLYTDAIIKHYKAWKIDGEEWDNRVKHK